MASKDIDKFLAALEAKGIASSEATVRRRLAEVKRQPKDLRNLLLANFVYNSFYSDFNLRTLHKIEDLSTRVDELEDRDEYNSKRIDELQKTVDFLMEENEGFRERLNMPKVTKKDDEAWRASFTPGTPVYTKFDLLELDDPRHVVNWIGNLSKEEIVEHYYDYAEMDFDNPNHPRFR